MHSVLQNPQLVETCAKLTAAGKSVKEIAAALGISEGSVRKIKRCGLTDPALAASWADTLKKKIEACASMTLDRIAEKLGDDGEMAVTRVHHLGSLLEKLSDGRQTVLASMTGEIAKSSKPTLSKVLIQIHPPNQTSIVQQRTIPQPAQPAARGGDVNAADGSAPSLGLLPSNSSKAKVVQIETEEVGGEDE